MIIPERLMKLRTPLFRLSIGATFLIYCLPTLVLPVGRDQGLFMYIGKRLLAGEVLYSEIWDVKSPLLYYVYAFLGQLFGFTAFGIRAGDMLVIAVSTFLIYQIGARFMNQRIGALGSIIFVATYYQHDFRVLGNSESLLIPFMLLTVFTALLAEKKSQPWLLLISGIAFGAAIAIKSTALFSGFPVFLYTFVFQSAQGPPKLKLSRQPLLFCSGALLVFILYMLLLALNGSMSDWYELNAIYLPHYASLSHTAGYWMSMKLFIWYLIALSFQHPLLLLGVSLALTHICWSLKSSKRVKSDLLLVLAVSIAGLMAVGVQGQYVTYHALTFIPFTTLISAYGVVKIYEMTSNKLVLALTAAVFLTAFVVVSRGLPARWADFTQTIAGTIDNRAYTKRLSSKSYNLDAVTNVSQYVLNASDAGDKLLVWTFEPEIYFLTDLDHSSRFLFNTVFINNGLDANWRKEIVSDIGQSPPKFIIIGTNDGRKDLTGISSSSLTELQNFPELKSVIDREYVTDTLLEGFMIKKHKSQSPRVD